MKNYTSGIKQPKELLITLTEILGKVNMWVSLMCVYVELVYLTGNLSYDI